MKIGTYYYPEQWPRSQWERDFDRIAEMGFKIVHMAEFAWFSLEPTAGDFQFDWLSECVEMAAARGLDVILCTPTAAPPVWLTDEFSEVLATYQNAPADRHGGRRHYTPTSLRMQEATLRIVTAMADRFGDHPAVVGWQIDNELGRGFDQSEHTHRAFRAWLRKKYATIDALNAAWGNQFWNQYYQSFDQILMPGSRDPQYANPHHHLDGSRFWSRAWADFVKLQADMLKPRVGDRWITTNFMPFFLDCDPGEMADSLSLYSWDSYPVSGWGRSFADQSFRLGDLAQIECLHDQMASYTGRWALMEVQPGQINWSGVPVKLLPGTVRMWLWNAIAHGCEFITVYRFRQPRFGVEMWHAGLVGMDGVAPSQGGEEFAQVARECVHVFDAHPSPTHSAQPRAGLLLDFDQLWLFATLPQAKRWNYSELICQYHQALSRMGFKVEILSPDRPWPSGLKVVVAPGVQMVDDALIAQFNDYVRAGGHLLFTARCGLNDRNAQFFEDAIAAPIVPLIGADVTGYDALPEDTYGTLTLGGTSHRWSVWADQLRPHAGTETWATYADQFYAGDVAITHHKHHAGSVTYNGVYGDRKLAEAIVERLCRTLGHTAEPLPDGVRVLERAGLHICFNSSLATVDVPAPAGTSFLVGQKTLKPTEVAVWR
jgi:beta-galactosidase